MAALKLRDGATFDPQAFYDWCEQQVNGGSMDRKWFPDFVRIVTDFEYTETQKVLVRHLKQVHFDAASCRKPNSTGVNAVIGRSTRSPRRISRPCATSSPHGSGAS